MYRIQFKHDVTGREELLHEAQYSYETEPEANKVVGEMNAANNPSFKGNFTVVFEKVPGELESWRR